MRVLVTVKTDHMRKLCSCKKFVMCIPPHGHNYNVKLLHTAPGDFKTGILIAECSNEALTPVVFPI